VPPPRGPPPRRPAPRPRGPARGPPPRPPAPRRAGAPRPPPPPPPRARRGRLAPPRRSVARLRLLLPALPAALACDREDHEPSPEELVAALPLRLFAVGAWETDPVLALVRPAVSADGPLLRLAAADDPDLAALAGLLLGIRARRDDRGRVEPRLPPAAREAFREGLAAPSPPLCLRARAVARRADRPDLAGAAADYRTLLTRAAERLAVTGGADVAL